MKTVKVTARKYAYGVPADAPLEDRVELFTHDVDGNERYAVICKTYYTPRPRAGVAEGWERQGEQDSGYQWWVATN